MDETPTFNLKAVIQETGLKPDTLRAWERRYGLPSPKRTPGGHRLYSGRDIDMLKWLIARQEEGLSISRAVELWRARVRASRRASRPRFCAAGRKRHRAAGGLALRLPGL
jgi:DNA-binding transcriptional MerR regulator